MLNFRHLGILFLALLPACGSSGGGSDSRPVDEPGSVLVVLDTRAGDDALVQFQVAGATLEDAAGLTTPNLLRQSAVVTFDDPNGEASGLRLWAVPGANYEALHLILVPGSGLALDAAGIQHAVQGPIDVRVPIPGGLLHAANAASWLVVGHDSTPLSGSVGGLVWQPDMSARAGAEPVVLDGLEMPVATAAGAAVTARGHGDAVLRLEWAAGCEFLADDGSVYQGAQQFADDLASDDRLCVDADLRRDGTASVHRVRRGTRSDNIRLIGRVLAVDAAEQRFDFEVRATNWLGDRTILPVPEQVVVHLNGAPVARPNGALLAFGDIEVGKLAKVYWDLRFETPGQPDEYQASRVEVPGSASAQLRPQWRGRVISVDLTTQTIAVERQGGPQFVLQGQLYPQFDVVVGPETVLERRGQGNEVFPINLGDVQPGVDRIWFRGDATTPPTVEASSVRVRAF